MVGAGISGLTAALQLVERGVTVRILEAGRGPGGVIKTLQREGFLLEAGPDSFLTEKPAALDLCRKLQLEDHVIGTAPEHRRSFIVRNGRLYPTPTGFHLLAPLRWPSFFATPLLSWRGKLRAVADLWLPRGPEQRDESLASFVRRRFGPELLERLAQPLVAGIYTADAEMLSLRATFPLFLDMEQYHRSVIRGLRKQRLAGAGQAASGARYGLFATLREGLGGLVQALVSKLPEGIIHFDQQVDRMVRKGPGWRLDTRGRRIYEADAVCLACPAPVAGRLLKPVDALLAGALSSIPCASSVTVNLGYTRGQIRHPLNGFGFVVPAVEGRRLLACTFSSVKFPGRAPEGKVLLRAFMGGAMQPKIVEMKTPELEQAAHQELQELLGITGSPLFAQVHLHPLAMPQYTVGHLDRVAQLRHRVRMLPGLALAGNAYGGIGLPDCIASGESAATALLEAPAVS